MTSPARLLGLAILALSVACPRIAEPPGQLSTEERIDALGRAQAILISAGDLDGDGADQIVLTPTTWTPPAARVAGTSDAKSFAALLDIPGVASATDVVLTRDETGDFAVAPSNEGFDFSLAERVGGFVPGLVEGFTDTLLGALRDPGAAICGAISGVVNMVAGGVAVGSIGTGEAVRFVRGTIFRQDTTRLEESIQRYRDCLGSGQTFSGCVQGDIAEVFGRRDHCYQVSDTGSGVCRFPRDTGTGSRLCSVEENGSCCNRAFIFDRVFRADLRNQTPLLVEPAHGPMPEDGGTVFLGSPISIANSSELERQIPGGAAAHCLFNSTVDQRNPVRVVVDAGAGCVINETLPGHVLEGRVEQCVHEDAQGVYTTILGSGENTRLSWANEFEGTRLFSDIRDQFRANVRATLNQMNQLGMSCDGANVDGGTVTIDPDGGVAITPTNGATVLVGVAWGDPHLRTQDGTAYDFQKVGEFLLVDGTDGARVQVRLRPYGTSRYASVIVSLAARVGSERVQIDARAGTARLLLNGVETEPVDLPGGGRLAHDGIAWSDGTRLAVLNAGSYLSLYLYLPPTRAFHGLLGDRNGVAHDDFRLRDGTVLQKPLDADAWNAFGEDWRISQAESLFEYDDGESTTTFTDLTFPDGPFTAASLSPAAYAAAREVCLAAGITDPVLLDACILDVGVTGDSGFAEASRRTPAPRVGGQAAHDFAKAPESMTVDRVGVFTLTPNGGNDGVFTTTVQGPISSILLQSVNAAGAPASAQYWDTRAGDAVWFLGVEENGVLINNADSSIPTLSEGVHHLKLYATSSGYFVPGYHFRLVLSLPDGSTLLSPVVAY